MTRALLATLFSLFALPAFAWDSADDVLTHRILPGWVAPDGRHMAGLELTLAPGWKTYWRTPGDAGIPPEFDWSRARNLRAADVLWPAPQVFWQSGMRSIGYETRVVLPLALTPNRAGQPIRLRGQMLLGVCAEVCIPATLKLDATLPADAATRTPELVAALAARPFTEREAGVSQVTCTLRPGEYGLDVTAVLTMPPVGRGSENAVIEAPLPGVWVSEAKTTRRGDRLEISAEMVAPEGGVPPVIDRSGIRITVIGPSYAVDVQGCDSP